MTSIGIIAYSTDKEAIAEAINFVESLPGLKIIYVKQSEKKLYVVTDRIFKPGCKEANDDK